MFISYAHPTAPHALSVAGALRALGYEVWLDDQIPAHRSFGEVIEERVEAAEAVVVIWSAAATRSEWVRSEAGRAREAGKLVQMAIEPVTLPMPFDTIECARLFGWMGDVNAPGWTKVVEGVAALVGGAAARPAAEPQLKPGKSPRPLWSRWTMGAAGVLAIGLASILVLAVRAHLQNQGQPPSMLSIAVMPFRNLSGDPAKDATAETLTQDLKAAFERSGFWRAVSPSEIQGSPERAVDDLGAGRKLRVRFVVSGSLRQGVPGLRVSYRVRDTADGQVLSDGDLVTPASDTAVAEPQLAARLFWALTDLIYPKFIDDQLARPANDRDPENLDARITHLISPSGVVDRAHVPTVERLIASIKAIPDSNPMKGVLDTDACDAYDGMIPIANSSAQRLAWSDAALDLAAQAIRLRPSFAPALNCRVATLLLLKRWDEALAEANIEIKSIVNTGTGYIDRGNVEFSLGEFDKALADYTQQSDLNVSPLALGITHLFLGHYDLAIENLRQYEANNPRNALGPFLTTAALELAGRRDEARSEAALYRRLNKDDTAWGYISISQTPAFLAAASRVRRALHDVGLDEPAQSGR